MHNMHFNPNQLFAMFSPIDTINVVEEAHLVTDMMSSIHIFWDM